MHDTSTHFRKLSTYFEQTHYSLIEKIGEGGFGQVYKGLNQKTGQKVAIKCLSIDPNLTAEKSQRYIERFERETYLNSRLQHSNIVRLLDKGQCNEALIYAVFEYVEGLTLKDHLFKSGPLSSLETASIMGQVLDALVHAHEEGIIHRDIKPANIMLVPNGANIQAKILDFGIGAFTRSAREQDYKTLTLTQETLGTPSYSAPEQLRGEPPTAKTDLYVWGLVFIECLTGKPCVSGASLASIFQKQLNSNHVPIPTALMGHPIASLLRRVLNKKVEERAGNAQEIRQVFNQINFSNLVGEIKDSNPVQTHASGQHSNETFDETLIQSETLLQSGLKERKQITALCVTINMEVISKNVKNNDTAFDTDVINTLHQDQKGLTIDLATRYGGYHAGSLGDTLLFYFGYPSTTDNDSRLCARAALEITSQITKRNTLLKRTQGVFSSLQIGMHSGMITVYNDIMPEGETPNLAMALARQAQSNQIVCSTVTRTLLENYIDFDTLDGSISQLGVFKLPLFLIKGERHFEALGFLRSATQKHDFIGRDQELAALSKLLEQNTSLRSMHAYGEAGIGKSRLIHEFRKHANNYNHIIAQCLPEYENSAIFPVLRIFEQRFSLSLYSNEEKITVLEKLILTIQSTNPKLTLFILCAWLNIELPESDAIPEITPDESKSILFQTLIDLLCLGNEQDLNEKHLFIFEDLHWADPTTVDFISSLLESSTFKHAQHVLVTTSRKSLPTKLKNEVNQSIELKHLSESNSIEFITTLFEQQKVSEEVQQLLVTRTDGIPLFIEELVNMLKQKEWVHHLNGQIQFVDSVSTQEIPSNLRDSLQQKLDGLNQAKETAQLAAAIGREFDYYTLQQSAQYDDAQLQKDLDELIEAELIYLQRNVSGDHYFFKHALVRDAAYDSMISTHKVQVHKQIAQSMEQALTPSGEQNSSILAMHWAIGEVYEKAVEFGCIAANNALKRSSANETIVQAEKNQTWIEKLPEAKQTSLLITNYGILTSAYMEAKGWASDEVRELSEQSAKLLRNSGQYDELVSKLWWDVLNGVVGGHRNRTKKTCEEMETCFNQVNSLGKAAIRCAQAFDIFSAGEANSYPHSKQLLLESLQHYSEAQEFYEGHEQVYGFNIDVFSQCLLAQAYCVCGNPTKAQEIVESGLALARKIENIPSIGISLMYCAELNILFNNKAETKHYANELVKLSNQYELVVYAAYGQMQLDWADASLEHQQQTLVTLQEGGSYFSLAHYQSLYADTLIQQGSYLNALAIIDNCIAMDAKINHNYYMAKLLYLKALCKKELNFNDEYLDTKAQALKVSETAESKYYTQLINEI